MKLTQDLINRINAKQSFSHVIGESKRYLSGCKNLYTGNNPSLNYYNVYNDLSNLENTKYDSIGGWLDSETGLYYVDYCKSFNNVFDAMAEGRTNGELAIWDNVENKEILLIK
jgi:hypothetical protein|tara:strand:- start:3154 stop:3492 length:339 start_codon:yes stop_codon:yes gene_type:complete